MKRKIVIILLIASCFLCANSALAVDLNLLQLSDTSLEEEFVNMKSELVADINNSLASREFPLISEDDIDLDRMFPYYMNDNFFSDEINCAEDFLNLVDSQEYYLWMLPLEIENQNVLVAIGRTRPIREETKDILTEDQLDALEAKVGKWGYVWCKYSDVSADETNWSSTALKTMANADQVVLVNGLETTNSVMAVCIKNGILTDAVSMSDVTFQVRRQDVSAINAVTEIASSDGIITLQRGEIFSYQDMQQTLGQLTPDESQLASGGGTQFQLKSTSSPYLIFIIVTIAFLVAGVIMKFAIQFRKR